MHTHGQSTGMCFLPFICSSAELTEPDIGALLLCANTKSSGIARKTGLGHGPAITVILNVLHVSNAYQQAQAAAVSVVKQSCKGDKPE